jgi:putative glycosyltransferase (TIGR04372 family)
MRRLNLPSKIGWFPNCYGRICDFLCGAYIVSIGLAPQIEKELARTVWFSLNREEFPYLHALLSKYVRLTTYSQFLFLLYRALFKLRLNQLLLSPDTLESLSYIEKHIDTAKIKAQIHKMAIHDIDPRTVKCLDELTADNRPLVLLYARNGDWDTIKYGSAASHTIQESFRNVDPSLFEPVIKHLIRRGFAVIRIGRDKVHLDESPFFWNYASDSRASDLMDLLIWSQAKVLITTMGGADQLKRLFEVPTLYLNLPESPGATLIRRDIPLQAALPMVYQDDRKVFPIATLIDFGIFERKFFPKDFSKFRIQQFSNSASDMLKCVDDFMELIKGNSRGFRKIEGAFIHKRWPNLKP